MIQTYALPEIFAWYNKYGQWIAFFLNHYITRKTNSLDFSWLVPGLTTFSSGAGAAQPSSLNHHFQLGVGLVGQARVEMGSRQNRTCFCLLGQQTRPITIKSLTFIILADYYLDFRMIEGAAFAKCFSKIDNMAGLDLITRLKIEAGKLDFSALFFPAKSS